MRCQVPVFYATKDGQTRKIAEYLAGDLRARGLDARAIDVESPAIDEIDWPGVQAVIVGSPLYAGKHLKSAAAFVRAHRDQLNERPTAFFSVSLSAGSSRPEEVKAASDLARKFIEDTAWYADDVASFAGCLAYTKYGFFKRMLMKRIAKKEGGSLDTTRDHEYTDWSKVTALADRMATLIRSRTRPREVA
jgi:menaquinone-dependent protoporphyrinogen oxidase